MIGVTSIKNHVLSAAVLLAHNEPKLRKKCIFVMMISLISSFSDILTSSRFRRFFRLIVPAAVLGLIVAGSLKNLTF